MEVSIAGKIIYFLGAIYTMAMLGQSPEGKVLVKGMINV